MLSINMAFHSAFPDSINLFSGILMKDYLE